jgi:MGT family glycosyltransferase
MARFLFTVWPITGHVYPQVAIAQALRDRGHECAFFTGNRVAYIVKREGFEHFPFCKVDEEKFQQTLFPPQRGPLSWSNPMQFMNVLRGFLLETLPQQFEDLDPLIRRWRPDTIATDPTFWSPVLIFHEKLGIPVAISSFCPVCMVPGPEAPPFGLGLPAPRDWRTRLLARGAYLLADLATVKFRRGINAIRQSHGLPPLTTSVTAYTGTMPLYLVPSAPEFDFDRHDLPPSVHYVGPLFRKLPPTDTAPAWVAALSRERPWVYVTEGTIHVSEPAVLRSAAQGLANLPMEVVLITGDDRDPSQVDLGPRAPNVHLDRWVAYPDILPHTKVMITSGGPGSVLAALLEGIPLIIIPTEWDKPDIARRVADSGAAVCMSPRKCTPKTIRAAVERLLSEDSFRRSAQRLGRILAGYAGAPRAAELLEELACPKGVPVAGSQGQVPT